MTIQTLIIVPARSGSKGLPDKNIRLLGGIPLIGWTARVIQQAQLANSLAILSTDSPAYAEIGHQVGLQVPFVRPADCASDSASALQVVQHALAWFETGYGYLPEQTLWLQPTSPFRTVSALQTALSMLDTHAADAVVACQTIHRDLTTLFNVDDGFLRPLDANKTTQTSRQQVQPLLTPNGALYLCKTDYLLVHQSFYPPKTLPLPMNAIESLDIDTEEHWAMAEAYVGQGLIGAL